MRITEFELAIMMGDGVYWSSIPILAVRIPSIKRSLW